MKTERKSKGMKITGLITSALLGVLMAFGFEQAYRLLEWNIRSYDGEEHLVYVYPETTRDSLISMLKQDYKIAVPWTISLYGDLMKWPAEGQDYVKTGCYKVPSRCGNLTLIRMFRSGNQEPVRLQFRGVRTPSQLAQRLAMQLMIDSATIADRLSDEVYMAQYGLSTPTAVCLFLPDTYEVWWNMSVDDLFARMNREYNAFWNEERRNKAAKLGLTPQEVCTLASIVEEETNKDVDKPIVAGLYLNRLRLGMPLQACPTIKFAWQDFGMRRITQAHLNIDSPYNTYKQRGLPPGPIRIPTGKTMDFVLNPTPSNYLFMCASTAFDGTHHFSTTYAEHARYAKAYQQELNRRNIH